MKENYNIQIGYKCPLKLSNIPNFIDGKRFCELCDKNVYDLRNLSDQEIHNLTMGKESICGRIQVDRISNSNINNKGFFRKLITSFALFAFITNAFSQRKESDTLRTREIEGFTIVALKSDENNDVKENYYRPQIKELQVQYSGNDSLLNNYNQVSILTLNKKYNTGNHNIIKIGEDYLGFKNIFVFENGSNRYNDINENQYYTFINKNKFKDDKIIDLNLDKVKKITFEQKNKEFIYFLDGEEISKEEFEQKRKDRKIESYFLSEIYAKEILSDNYNVEDGIILSYSK